MLACRDYVRDLLADLAIARARSREPRIPAEEVFRRSASDHRAAGDGLLADRLGPKGPRVQDVESPTHVERLAQPTRARRPRVEVKTCALVPRLDRADRIVGNR